MALTTDGQASTQDDSVTLLRTVHQLLSGIQTDCGATEQGVKGLTAVLAACHTLDPVLRSYLNAIHTHAARLCCVQALLNRQVWDECQEGRLQAAYRELKLWLIAQIPETEAGLRRCETEGLRASR